MFSEGTVHLCSEEKPLSKFWKDPNYERRLKWTFLSAKLFHNVYLVKSYIAGHYRSFKYFLFRHFFLLFSKFNWMISLRNLHKTGRSIICKTVLRIVKSSNWMLFWGVSISPVFFAEMLVGQILKEGPRKDSEKKLWRLKSS